MRECRVTDPLDDYIDAVGTALALPIEAAWKPAVRANLAVTLNFLVSAGKRNLTGIH